VAWIQFIFASTGEQAENLSDQLQALGAVAVTLSDAADQPVYEPALNTTPVWSQTHVSALFADGDWQALQQAIQTLEPLPFYQVQRLKDQDWVRVCLADFQPMRFGQRLWVCPSWQAVPDPQAVNILLDPGLAFGTGTHPTTALCLACLDGLGDLSGQTWVDYGCGSGILAIAAAKLGAEVWAVDNDPQALLATHNNAVKNQVAHKITAVLPENLPALQADGLLANILANPLLQLAPTLATLLKPQAQLTLSGILSAQAEAVLACYAQYFNHLNTTSQAGWLRIDGKKS
jgi:ribosomal protein L11 methyltransferase